MNSPMHPGIQTDLGGEKSSILLEPVLSFGLARNAHSHFPGE
jgi:hypothetical protein